MSYTFKIVSPDGNVYPSQVGPKPTLTIHPEPKSNGEIAILIDTRGENEYRVYQGDEAYLMNQYGSNVHTIRSGKE